MKRAHDHIQWSQQHDQVVGDMMKLTSIICLLIREIRTQRLTLLKALMRPTCTKHCVTCSGNHLDLTGLSKFVVLKRQVCQLVSILLLDLLILSKLIFDSVKFRFGPMGCASSAELHTPIDTLTHGNGIHFFHI